MLRKVSLYFGVITLFYLISSFYTLQEKAMKVYLIGDSTMSVKAENKYPETGWGMPFVHFFNDKVKVDNRAMNGRSTRTFLEEGRWESVLETLNSGDYVFIQFGHNDESEAKTDRYTDPETYKKNLSRFVSESRQKGAIPLLLTPISRRYFDENGKITATHAVYSPLVKEVAEAMAIPLLDMDALSQAMYQELGPETSKLLFLHLEPGEHPNYPEGKVDDTHFNELGARKIAQLVLSELQRQEIPLAQYIVLP